MKHVIYRLDNGVILREYSGPESMLAAQLNDGEGYATGSGSWLTHHVVDGQLVELETPRTPPTSGAMWRPDLAGWVDDSPLEQLRAARWEQIKVEREQRFYAPIEVGGIVVDADRDSVANIMGAIMEMQLTGTETRRWTLHDNTRMDLTLAQLIAIGAAIAERKEVLQNQSQDMRQLIEAAATAAEVAAVDWP